MKHVLFSFFCFTAISSISQIDVDKPINLSGVNAADRAVTNLAPPVAGTDAANKDYVDAQSGGGMAHYIGELFGGGMVIEVHKDTNGDERGLIMSLVNNSNAAAWSNVSSTLVPGSAAQSWTNGSANTNAIVAQSGHTSSAAKICKDYNAGGHTDWYLPALEEVGLIYEHMFSINRGLTSAGATRIDYEYYWTSTESNASSAQKLSFFNSNESFNLFSPNAKNSLLRVRCVRAF
jgi:hypothetical protein